MSGKNIWSSELSASMRTWSRRHGICSSSGISCLRLEDGKASKSRLRGHFDGALILGSPWSQGEPDCHVAMRERTGAKAWRCQAFEHQADHGEPHEGEDGFCVALEV